MREKQPFGLCLAFSLLLIIIISSSSSSLSMALSKSSSHIPLLTSHGISVNDRISVNDETGPSNINDAYNQSFSTSRPYFAHAPSDYTSDDNVSSAVNNSNNKVVMIGFDDGWKSQITYAKPILDKYGFKASFFVVCNYATLEI